MRTLYHLLLALALAGPASAQQLQDAFPNLTFSAPVDVQAPDDGSNRLFVVEQAGRIRVFPNTPSATSAPVFLDITGPVASGGELGLLGLAFDPAYTQNGYFYVNYTRDHPDEGDPQPYQDVVARYRVDPSDPNQALPGSGTILLTIDDPYSNHNAGQLQFGPDGYLYVGTGDGGSGGDPQENGQDPTALLAKMLRLDVDGGGDPLDCGAGTGSARVPPDNPFADGPGGTCDEIWALGFRNPYRYSFDSAGRLWVADVGQNEWEEIDLVAGGQNHGWNEWEGNHCYDGPCAPDGLTFPIYEYPHDFNANGGFAVIGGYVYEEGTCPDLRGRYVYGDNVTGNIWSLAYDGQTADNDVLFALSGENPSTFGLDEQGDLYLADLDDGEVLRFACQSAVTVAAALVSGSPVPSGGGVVTFDVTLTNTTGQAQTVDVWLTADLSNGAETGAVVGPRTVTLPPATSVTRRVQVNVPAFAPAGTSTAVVRVGDHPDNTTALARFTIRKEASGPGERASDGAWEVLAWDFSDGAPAAAVAADVPADLALAAPTPNPFASRTTMRYALPQPAAVRLAVYDVLGREVAVLANGVQEAGAHEAAFDAGRLPSGLYLVRLEADGEVLTQRVTLRK